MTATASDFVGKLSTQAVMPGLHQGQRLLYDISWGIFSAGEAVLDVRHVSRKGGRSVYEVELSAHTSGLFSAIYPLETVVRSTLSADLSRTLAFHKTQNGRDTRILFDWKTGTATYINDGEELEPIDLPRQALDPLGLVMAVRPREIKKGSKMETWFTDGKRAVRGNARVKDKEQIQTPAGTFSTALVVPSLDGVGGIFSHSRKPSLQVWISRDAMRLPVRFTSKIKLGHITGELKEVQTLQPPL